MARRASGPTPLESTQFFKQASIFDQNDFHSANLEFETELADFEAWLEAKGNRFKEKHQDPGFDNNRDEEWEEIATWWTKSPTPPKVVMELFDDYVHDSRAWFKLIPRNPDSEEGMHEKLKEWVRRRDYAASINEKRAKERALIYGGPSQPSPVFSDGLTRVQSQLADEYSKMPKGQETIPKMITEGREPYGFKSKAGYLRFRKIYGGWDSVLLSATPEDVQDITKVA